MKLLPSARERQVRRALAAERARRRRDVDAEVAMYRTWVLRAIPWVAGLNVAMIAFLIWRGMPYAITANITVLPLLWLARWTVRLADARQTGPPGPVGPPGAPGPVGPPGPAVAAPTGRGGGLPTKMHTGRAEKCAACGGPLHTIGRNCVDPACPLGPGDAHEAPRDCIFTDKTTCDLCGAPWPGPPEDDDDIPF